MALLRASTVLIIVLASASAGCFGNAGSDASAKDAVKGVRSFQLGLHEMTDDWVLLEFLGTPGTRIDFDAKIEGAVTSDGPDGGSTETAVCVTSRVGGYSGYVFFAAPSLQVAAVGQSEGFSVVPLQGTITMESTVYVPSDGVVRALVSLAEVETLVDRGATGGWSFQATRPVIVQEVASGGVTCLSGVFDYEGERTVVTGVHTEAPRLELDVAGGALAAWLLGQGKMDLRITGEAGTMGPLGAAREQLTSVWLHGGTSATFVLEDVETGPLQPETVLTQAWHDLPVDALPWIAENDEALLRS